MPSERLTFPGHSGHDLDARLDLPEGPHLATALFAHCFTCGKDIAAARRIAQRLAAMGIAVLRFDFTGLGHSGGEFANTTFASNVEDLVAAAEALAARGHAPAAEVDLGGRPVTIGRRFVEEIAAERLGPAIADLRRALLVLHAPRDGIVGIDNAANIFMAAKHPKSFVTLADADHLVTDPADADYAAEVIATWAGRYLDLRPPAPPPGAPEGVVRVSEADAGGFLQDVTSGEHHHVLADEPQSYGGTDRGMSPYGFLSAGLGACTSMTLRMYARRKGWPLAHVRVDVTHDKVHAQDAAAAGPEQVDRFTRVIHLEGELDTEQRARLLEMADRCPVHRTLERQAHIETRLSD